MHLQQADIQIRIAIPDFGDGYYYWTQCWIYDLDNPPSDNPSLYWIYTAYHQGLLSVCQTWGQQRIEPPYSGNIIAYFTAVGDHGLLTPADDFSIFDTVRLNFYAGGEYVGYKRWRVPLRGEDMQGGRLSDTMYNLFVTTITPILLHAKITSRYGVLIDEIRTSPYVHQWQWRHGSKRRTRPVVVAP